MPYDRAGLQGGRSSLQRPWPIAALEIQDLQRKHPHKSLRFSSSSVTWASVVTRVTGFDCKIRKEKQAAPQRTQSRMMRTQLSQKPFEFVGLFHRDREFFQQCLQVLLSRLLAVKADLVMKRLACVGEFRGGLIVGFGLAHPLARGFFHIRLFPW